MTPAAKAKCDTFFAGLGDAPALMGIVNVTPDSFWDGGRFAVPTAAIAEAHRHVAGGAAIIDVGAESTRPGATPVTSGEEKARLARVLAALIDAVDVAVSIDTMKACIAVQGLEAGAAIVNDQWGLQGDPAMASVVADAGAGLVIMHNRLRGDEDDIVDALRGFFDRSLAIAGRAGIARDRIILDPGIGFGKSKAQNLRALGAGVAALSATFGLPVLVGVSRKSLFAGLIGKSAVEDRLVGTLAADIAALAHGARIFRVHDCADHRDAFAVHQAIARA